MLHEAGPVATCDLTGLRVFQCAHCIGTVSDGEDPVRASLLESLTHWTAADHPGRCVNCGTPYPAGAAIAPEDEGWRADCCPRRPATGPAGRAR